MLIREATISDAPGLARVAVDTWRTTYGGIMAADHLANLSYHRSEAAWCGRISDAACFTYLAEDDSGKVIGYAHAGPARDFSDDYPGELYGLYVLKEHQVRGVGRNLMEAVAQSFSRRGINAMIIWVLSANPSRGFYEKMGGRKLSCKTIEIGGKELEETAYVWDIHCGLSGFE